MPSSPAVSFVGREVGDLHHPARAPADRVADLGHARAPPSDARVQRARARARSGRPRAIAASASGEAGRVGGHEPHVADAARSPAADSIATWPMHALAADVGLQRRPRRAVAGSDPADRAEQAAGFVERRGRGRRASRRGRRSRGCRARGRRARPSAKRCSNAAGHGPSSRGERDEALAQVAGRGHAEVAPQPARTMPPSSATLTTAVISPAYSRDGAQRDRRARAHRPARRRCVGARVRRHGRRPGGARRCGSRGARRRSASCSAITTLRCRPPVQPNADREVRLALALVAGQQQREQAVELVEELAACRAGAST